MILSTLDSPMLASLLTTLFFALSAVVASRTAKMLGAVEANLFRLLIAALLLTGYAFVFGQGFQGPGVGVFLLSGLVGFGLGDVALFFSYRGLGAMRGVLLAQSLAVPFAALTEWLWLGTALNVVQSGLILVILLGVGLAVAPSKRGSVTRTEGVAAGILCGVLAGVGQAWGAVLSRKAFAMNADAGILIDGWTSGFQRVWAGIVVAVLFYAWFRWRERRRVSANQLLTPHQRAKGYLLCAANALAGPVLGVGCYQWALSGTPSGLVLAIVATTPLAVMPLSWILEKERLSGVSVAGAMLAVCGVALLVFLPR